MPLTIEERQALRDRNKQYMKPQNDYLALVSRLPEQDALKVLNVSARTGLDINEAAKNPNMVIDSIIHPDEFAALQKSHPATYQFLNSDPLYLAAVRSKKKVMSLANLEEKNGAGTALMNGLKGIGRAFVGAGSMITDLAKEGKNTAPMTFQSKVFSMDTVKRFATTVIPDIVIDTVDYIRPALLKSLKAADVKADTAIGQFGYDVLQNAPQVLAQVLIAYASGGMTAPTLFMGSQIAGGQYADLREDGVGAERAAQASTANALLQAPLEKIGLGKIMSVGGTAKGKAREIFKTALTEGLTEWMQQYPEEAASIWAKNQKLSNVEQVAKFIDEFGEITERGMYAGGIGAVFGGAGGAVKVAFQKEMTAVNVDASEERVEAMRKSGIEPVILQGYAEMCNPQEKVYVDGEALAQAMYQSNDTELAHQLGVSEEKIQKAAGARQMVEIDRSKYDVAMMDRPQLQQSLRKDIAFEEDGLTLNQLDSRNAADIKKAQEEILREQSEIDSVKKEVYEQWKHDTHNVKNVNAGMLNNAMVALIGHAKQFAEAENMTAAEWMRKYAPVMRQAIYTNQNGMMQPINADVDPNTRVQPVDITNALPETIVTNKDLVAHIKRLAAEGTALSTADSKAIMSILPKDIRHIVYSSNKMMKTADKKIHKGALLSVKDLIQNSILVESIPNTKVSKKPNVLNYHRFYVPVKINNVIRTLRIVAEEQKGTHSLTPTDVNLYDIIVEKSRPANGALDSVARVIAADGSLSTISIQDMLKGVKDADGNQYFQSEGNNPRGMIQWNEEGRAIISLFEKADASTVIHEMVGHFFMDNLLRVGNLDTAPKWMRDARKTMLEFGGIESWETATVEERRKAHEKWAGAAETYLMEGKAPSLELRNVFRRFKEWITAVYKAIKQNKVELTDDVREVFDRMLASDAAIKEREIVEQYYKRLPPETLESLSDTAIKELDKTLLNAQHNAEEIVRKKMMNSITEENKAAMAEERVRVMQKISEDIAQEPLYRAADIVEEDFQQISKTAKGFAKKYLEWSKREISQDEEATEIKFDILAESLGFSSGNELAKKIIAAPAKAAEIQSRVEMHMEQRFEDIYGNPERIKEEAEKAMYNDDGAYLIAIEQQIIEEKLGNVSKADERRKLAALERENMRAAARKELACMSIDQAIRARGYILAERNAAKRAERALIDNDYALASYEKLIQLYNHALVMESLHIKREFEKIKNYISRQRKSKRDTWCKEEHFNQAAALMAKFGFHRKDYTVDSNQESLLEWAERMGKENDSIEIAPWLMYDKQQKRTLKELTLEQCEDFVNAMKNIKRVAQTEDKFFREDIKESISETVAMVEEKLSGRKDVYIPEAQPEPSVKDSIQQYFRSAEKITTFLNKLDNWHDFGYFYNLIYKPVYDAANHVSNILQEIKDLSNESINKWYPSKEEQKNLNKKEFYEELGDTVNRRYLIEMASHVGNEHNFNVLASKPPEGVKSSALWIEGDIDATKASIMNFLQENLTYKDWQYVQDGWNIINKLWPMAQAVHTKMTGFGMKKVEAKPFKVRLPTGEVFTLDGGY